MPKPIKAEIVEKTNGAFYFRFVAGNGRILNHDYNRAADAKRALAQLIEAIQANNFEVVCVPLRKAVTETATGQVKGKE